MDVHEKNSKYKRKMESKLDINSEINYYKCKASLSSTEVISSEEQT